MNTSPAHADDRWQAGRVSTRRRSVAGALLAGIAAFISLFRVGIPAATDSLDGSWTSVLSWAFSKGLQFGSDIVFTYGPLGFLIPIANFHPETFFLFFVAQLLLAGCWALLITRYAWHLPFTAQLLLGLLLLSWSPLIIIDVGWYLMFAIAAIFVQRDVKGSLLGDFLITATLLVLTVIALTKFTFLLIWLAFVGHLSVQLILVRRWIAAGVFVMAAAAMLLVLWHATGQQIQSLPQFFTRGLQISSGYNASMGIVPAIELDLSGLAVLIASAGCLIAGFFFRGSDWKQRSVGAFLMLLLALTWKAGFIRADAHMCIFFGTASLLSALSLCVVRSPSAVVNGLHWSSAIAVSVSGLVLTYLLLGGPGTTLRNTWEFASFSLKNVASPSSVRDAFQQSWDAGLQRFDLPLSRGLVGSSTVDMLMHEQGVVLLNRFNYKPRPAFQGYGAYSTQLARLNEDALLSASAPDFLLFKMQAIDSHLPGNEDPLSQLAALRAYALVGFEKGYALLQRNASTEPVRPPLEQHWRQTELGHEIPLPRGAHALFYRVELSLLGKVYSAVFREPAIGLEIVDGNGVTRQYRIARTLGDAGTLISPLLADNTAYMNWYARGAEFNPSSIRFVARAPAVANLFMPQIAYALQPLNLPRRDFAELPEFARKGFYSGFSHLPRREFSPAPIEFIRNLGEEVLFMHAPSHLEFVLPAGQWQADGKFGLRADSYAPGVCPQSDGTMLRVFSGAAPASAATPLLFSRQIDPQRVEADRGGLAFSIPAFTSDGVTPITFEFSGGATPGATTACDWTFIGPLQFLPANATSLEK